jgi:hypothetical protein
MLRVYEMRDFKRMSFLHKHAGSVVTIRLFAFAVLETEGLLWMPM